MLTGDDHCIQAISLFWPGQQCRNMLHLAHSTLDVARGGAVTVNRSGFLGVDEQQRINWKTFMSL